MIIYRDETSLPVVKIVNPKKTESYVIINERDFKPGIDTLWEDRMKAAEAAAEKAAAEKKFDEEKKAAAEKAAAEKAATENAAAEKVLASKHKQVKEETSSNI